MLPPLYPTSFVERQQYVRNASCNQLRRDGSIGIAVDAQPLVTDVAFHPDVARWNPNVRIRIRRPRVHDVAFEADDPLYRYLARVMGSST